MTFPQDEPPYDEDERQDRRVLPRRRTILAGKVTFGTYVSDCTIRNLSSVGAQIHLPSAVGLPDIISLLIVREGLVVRARRIWSRPPLFGLLFIDAENIETSKSPQTALLRRAKG